MRVDAGTESRRWVHADGTVAMCPRCYTPLFARPVERPPFGADGDWVLLYCPGDGCAYEEYVRRGTMERRTPDGRVVS